MVLTAQARGNYRAVLDFAHLATLEPRLRDLLAEARAYHRDRRGAFCANAVWFGWPGGGPGIKPRLCRLVGWGAPADGVLGTSDAFEVAVMKIYGALPACRGRCRCL
jgi:hypothetical protein